MDRFINKVVDKVTGDDDDDKKQQQQPHGKLLLPPLNLPNLFALPYMIANFRISLEQADNSPVNNTLADINSSSNTVADNSLLGVVTVRDFYTPT